VCTGLRAPWTTLWPELRTISYRWRSVLSGRRVLRTTRVKKPNSRQDASQNASREVARSNRAAGPIASVRIRLNLLTWVANHPSGWRARRDSNTLHQPS
jgi:hypothetical protein